MVHDVAIRAIVIVAPWVTTHAEQVCQKAQRDTYNSFRREKNLRLQLHSEKDRMTGLLMESSWEVKQSFCVRYPCNRIEPNVRDQIKESCCSELGLREQGGLIKTERKDAREVR